MAMARADVTKGYQAEVADFEVLLRSLDAAQWQAPTRCSGWRVADVAAHVTGALSTVVAGRLDEFADPDHVERHVKERAELTQVEVLDELHTARTAAGELLAALDDDAWSSPLPSGVAPTLGAGVETLWYDTYIHGDDVRTAVGLASDRGPGLALTVRHLAELLAEGGWGPATLALDGLEEIEVAGGGKRVSGDPLVFALAATGRADPAALGLDETVNVYR